MSTLCSVKGQTVYTLCVLLIAYIFRHPHPLPSPYLNACAAAFENTLLTFGLLRRQMRCLSKRLGATKHHNQAPGS